MSLQTSSFRFQEQDGWCGPAALQMLFTNSGLTLTQTEISAKIFDPIWGTSHENMYSFAKKYFGGVNVYTNTTLEKLKNKLNQGMLILANMVTNADDADSGHYINIASIDLQNEKMIVFDPDSEGGIYEMNTKKFEAQWFDYATEHDVKHKIKTEHWALVIDPTTQKFPTPT